MLRKITKLLVGKREKGEIGYYKKLAYVEDKLREFVLGVVLAIVVGVIIVLMLVTDTNGKYVPDGYDIHGNLIDTDGDGDYHHWVEE